MAVSNEVEIEIIRNPENNVYTVLISRDGDLKYKAQGAVVSIKRKHSG